MQSTTISRRKVLACGSAAIASTILAGGIVAPRNAAAAETVKDVLGRITKARADLRTLVAKFTQTRKISLLDSEVKSKGELSLVRPDRLRWELFPPDAVTYWVGPEGLAVRTKDGRVSRAPKQAGKFGAVLGDLMTIMGDDPSKLEARYTIDVKKSDGPIELVLTPKVDELKKVVSRIQLTTQKEVWALARVVVEEEGGDASTIDFSVNDRNVTIDPAKMKPPA